MIRAIALSRLRMTRRQWLSTPAKGGWTRHPAVPVAIALVLATLVYGGFGQAFGAIAGYGAESTARAGLLVLAFTGAFTAMLAFDVDDLVRSLLLDPDLEILRRSPISPGRILLIKGLDATPRTSIPLVVLVLPAIAAFLTGVPHPLAGAAAALVATTLLALATLAAGVGASLLLLRVAPASRTREALAVVSAVLLTVLWISGAMVLPRALTLQPGAATEFVHQLEIVRAIPGPAAAGARAIAAAAAGEWRAMPMEFARLAAFAIAAFLFAAIAASASLERVLERLAGARADSGPGSRAAARPFRWTGTGPARAVFRRDARMFRRDWPLMSDVFLSAGLWGLLPLAGLASGGIAGSLLSRWILLSLAIGLGYEVAARTIPFERHLAFWARVSPVSPRRYLLGKLLGAAAISLPLVLLVALAFGIAGLDTPEELLATLWFAIGALGVSQATGLWAGAMFGDPEWINPRAMLRFGGRLIAAVLVLIQLTGWLVASTLVDLQDDPIRIALRIAVPPVASLTIGFVLMRATEGAVAKTDSRH